MEIGRLNRRVLIERNEATQDAVGQPIGAWVPVAEVWASVEPLKGHEAVKAGQLLAEMDTRVMVRYSMDVSAVDAACRLRHGDAVFNIVNVANVRTANIMIEIMCKREAMSDETSTWLKSEDGEFLVSAGGDYLTA